MDGLCGNSFTMKSSATKIYLNSCNQVKRSRRTRRRAANLRASTQCTHTHIHTNSYGCPINFVAVCAANNVTLHERERTGSQTAGNVFGLTSSLLLLLFIFGLFAIIITARSPKSSYFDGFCRWFFFSVLVESSASHRT